VPVGYDLILDEIPSGARVLDLGCGDGVLLDLLREKKRAQCFGVEISEEGVAYCVEKGLYCYQGDIDEGLSDYRENSFDYVILNQTLQNTKRPDYVLKEIMRICRNTIISFPNFGFFLIRLQLLLRGKMPIDRRLPYEWYNSPNIHLLTIKDFYRFCGSNGYSIKKTSHFILGRDNRSIPVNIMPNLTAEFGYFVLDGEKFTE